MLYLFSGQKVFLSDGPNNFVNSCVPFNIGICRNYARVAVCGLTLILKASDFSYYLPPAATISKSTYSDKLQFKQKKN